MSRRNVELEGPISLQGITHPIYYVHYDCNCGRRLIVMASTDGMLLAGRDGVNTWKLTFGESRRLTVTPGIINHHGYGKPPCEVFITDEPFTWVHAREDLRGVERDLPEAQRGA